MRRFAAEAVLAYKAANIFGADGAMLDLKSLVYFIAVAEDLHFSRAADRLHVAQSALSVRIRQLEDRLGARLFARSKRSAVRLTQAGELFLAEARRVVQAAEQAESVGRRAGQGEVGHVAIGFVASAVFSGLLPGLLRRFRGMHPDVEVEISEMETPRQFAMIEDGLIDIGIVRARSDPPAGVKLHVLRREKMHVLLPADHPLAAADRIALNELSRETLISPHFDALTGFGNMLARLSGRDGFAPAAIRPVRDFLTVVGLVGGGYGVALVPDAVRRLAGDDVVMRPLDGADDLEAPLSLAYADRQPGPAVAAFLECARAD
ncbi:LysR family transcriptional regulator [Sphingomonas sp. DBB INV C78]|uniref:LysR substrate-binding domain-containing protein n=1 Tax=Sphingomonas sp. DBB INV C78 TaxID=3349434 RepID=UPI0036D3BF40